MSSFTQFMDVACKYKMEYMECKYIHVMYKIRKRNIKARTLYKELNVSTWDSGNPIEKISLQSMSLWVDK